MSAVADPAAGPRTGRGAPCDGAMIDDLGWALGVVFRSYAKAASLAFSELPGGPRGYQVLAAAARGEPGNQLKLAQHLGVDRTVMTYLLDKLENAGLIERRPDPRDRRARQIVATATGRERLEDLNRRLPAAWSSAPCCGGWRRTPTPSTRCAAAARSSRMSAGPAPPRATDAQRAAPTVRPARASRRGAAPPGLRSEEPATSDE